MKKTIVSLLSAILLSVPAYLLATEAVFLEQSWNNEDRDIFYHQPQGSQILPLSWFLALEQADSPQKFLADNLRRFGFLPSKVSQRNPHGLPVGFTVDQDEQGTQWLGMTCGACHTNTLSYQGQQIQIDGSAAQVDFFAFIEALDRSLKAVLAADNNNKKFARFLAAANQYTDTPNTEAQLRTKLQHFSTEWAAYIESSRSKTQWGPARNDAINMIINRVASIGLDLPANNHSPEVPVSYPYVWGASYHDKVQWNGMSPNRHDMDRLSRNTGQVLGVFAQVALEKANADKPYYTSSINHQSLQLLESTIRKLHSPQWPEAYLGKIDQQKARRGKVLYQAHCEKCHALISREEQHKSTKVKIIPAAFIGTDKQMVKQVCERMVSSGKLAGSQLAGSNQPVPAGAMKAYKLINHVVTGTLLSLMGQPGSLIDDKSLKVKVLEHDARQHMQLDCGPKSALMGYKARSLDGAWATGPFLHNGSVPNLYQLLLPAEQRVTKFSLGSLEFDPKHVGYRSELDNKEAAFVFDTSLPGNSNKGHDRNGVRKFTESQRWDLLEFLKTL